MAYDRDIRMNRRRLVVLVLEDITAIADQEIPSDIRNYLKRYTYIGIRKWQLVGSADVCNAYQ